jgi:hypothetical protein
VKTLGIVGLIHLLTASANGTSGIQLLLAVVVVAYKPLVAGGLIRLLAIVPRIHQHLSFYQLLSLFTSRVKTQYTLLGLFLYNVLAFGSFYVSPVSTV